MTIERECGKDQVIEFGTRRLQTNLWGVGENEKIPPFRDCVFNYGRYFGWRWDRSNPVPMPGDRNVSPIYPDITTGTSPWGGYHTNPLLPVQVNKIQSLQFEVKYMYTIPPRKEDSLNLAYDIWVIDRPVPDDVSLKTKKEIMVWANRQNVPMPAPKAQVDDGINQYDLMAWDNYNAFIPATDVLPRFGVHTHRADVKKLVDYLVQQNLIPADWYLAEIALGNEVWKGRGMVYVIDWSLNLNGVQI